MFQLLEHAGNSLPDALLVHQDNQHHYRNEGQDMKKTLITALFAILTAGSLMSPAVAAPMANSSLLPPIFDVPPLPPGCHNAILVISPDPDVGVYWKCLDFPGH